MTKSEDNHIVLRDYFMNKEDKIEDWTDNELILFHSITHQSFSNKNDKNLREVHSMIVKEYNRRGLQHTKFDELDEEDQ